MKQLALDLGQQKKKAVLEAFEQKGQSWLKDARILARQISYDKGQVTSDDVLALIGLPVNFHCNLVGALFSKGFYKVGYTQSKRPSAHARVIGIWRAK